MTVCGIFVGGRATRMQGQAKGLLPSPDGGEPLVLRIARIVAELGLTPVLVGDSASYRRALPGLATVADKPAGIGPLGGLSGLLAGQTGHVLALACDLPLVSHQLIERLALHPSRAAVLAPRSENNLWEPLVARYDAAQSSEPLELAIAAGTRSFQRFFAGVWVEELPLSERERHALIDWDTPEDVLHKR